MSERLNVVDENDRIIGSNNRHVVHRFGLLHRDVHIWVYSREGILVQRRAMIKKTWPGLFDASAGGHVKAGSNYIESAIKELEEETGIISSPGDLIFFKKIRACEFNSVLGTRNNFFRMVYLYKFNPNKDFIRPERSKVDSLEFLSAESISSIIEQGPKSFTPTVLEFELMAVIELCSNC